MGAVLIRSSFSANIKERRDCSTALFDERGRMIAQAEHIPVHLGAMPDAVAAVMGLGLEPGQVAILNDPYTGGTHLPDVTLVSRTALGYAVSRAHHADVGGIEPASLPAFSHTLEEEGVDPAAAAPDRGGARALRPGDAAAGGAARRPPRAARRAPSRRAAARGAVRAARPRARRRGDGRALRVLRADGAGRARRASGRPRRGGGRRRGGRRRPADPLHASRSRATRSGSTSPGRRRSTTATSTARSR